MEQFKHIDYEEDAKRCRFIVFTFLVMVAAIPVLTLSGVLKPENEPINIWFQRSGSIIVLLASAAEFYSIKMSSVFSPVLLANEPLFNTKAKYRLQAQKLMAVSAVFIAFGTIVWGYGDVIFKIA